MGRSDFYGWIGTSFHAKHWFNLSPMAFFGLSLSWGVHLYALIVIFSKLISNSLPAIFIYICFYLPVTALALVSLVQVSMTNPGAVPLGARPLVTFRRAPSSGDAAAGGAVVPVAPERAMRRCHRCDNNFKPARAHHDSVSGRCIVGFDHFCPWVGASIGRLNHKFFCLFLFYTTLSCLLSLLLLLIRAIHCGYYVDKNDTDTTPNVLLESPPLQDASVRFLSNSKDYLYDECHHFYDSQAVAGLLIASLVFLIFSCAMGFEQLEAIQTGKSKIARMKMRVGQQGTEYQSVSEEFNEMFGGSKPHVQWHWFWPSRVQYPPGMKKVVLGYEWDETLPPVPYQLDDAAAAAQVDEELGGTGGHLELRPVAPPSSANSEPLHPHSSMTTMTRSNSELDTRRRTRSGDDLPKVV